MKVFHFFSIHPYFLKITKRRFGETSKSDYIKNIKQAHHGFLPNYLLRDLFKSGKLALQVIPVEMSQDIKSDFMNQYLRAEVWIFSFMDYSVDFEAISVFFKDCRRLAKKYNIKIINVHIQSFEYDQHVITNCVSTTILLFVYMLRILGR